MADDELEWRRSYRDKYVHAFRKGTLRPFVAAEALCTHTVTNNYLGGPRDFHTVPISELCPMCLMRHGIELSEQHGERDAWT